VSSRPRHLAGVRVRARARVRVRVRVRVSVLAPQAPAIGDDHPATGCPYGKIEGPRTTQAEALRP